MTFTKDDSQNTANKTSPAPNLQWNNPSDTSIETRDNILEVDAFIGENKQSNCIRQAKNYSSSSPSKTKLCYLHLNSRCTHIRSCKLDHPKVCRYFIRGGRTQNGCTQTQCRFLHPRICQNSWNERKCLDLECPMRHLKHTIRYEPRTRNTRSSHSSQGTITTNRRSTLNREDNEMLTNKSPAAHHQSDVINTERTSNATTMHPTQRNNQANPPNLNKSSNSSKHDLTNLGFPPQYQQNPHTLYDIKLQLEQTEERIYKRMSEMMFETISNMRAELETNLTRQITEHRASPQPVKVTPQTT